ARFNPGNVVFFYPPYRVDLSLNFFIIAMVVLFALMFIIITTVRSTLAMPGRVEQYRATRQLRESGRALQEALKAYLEGRFGRAEKSATRASLAPEYAGLAALIGARSAHRLQQNRRRDEWLNAAGEHSALRTARLMTTVELLAEDNRQIDDALAAKLLGAGAASGDKLWRFPMGPAYDKLIDSPIADMKNVGPREGGSITAAQFIQRYVDKGTPWAHLDIAGMVWASKPGATWDKGATGFGVRILDRFVRDHLEG
ncbi:MAG: hypothetical protein RIQ99_1213, partial [Pseudomonadota bacterium]